MKKSIMNVILSDDIGSIGIFGTGLAGKETFEALVRMQVPVKFFLDGNNTKVGETFCDREIVEITEVEKDSVILIAANPVYGIHKRLEKAGLCHWTYVDPEYLHLYSLGYDDKRINSIYRLNEDKIRLVYDLLEDDRSKKVFSSILIHRMEHDLSLIHNIYDVNQYFGNDVIGSADGSFVDCGAYTGDTLKRFVQQVGGGGYHYYAFEAEKRNYDLIAAYCKENKITDIDIYNIAVSDRNKTIYFQQDYNNKKVGGKISDHLNENTVEIQGDSIDRLLSGIKIDMITMDIEGAEISALNGAAKCISLFQPRLAISAYHSIEHLWEIPLLIKNLCCDYKLYYRHHQWNMHDTVCYAKI